MIVTVASLITLAMDTVGAINVEEGPSPSELSTGLSRLNMMIDAWSVDDLMVRGTLMESFLVTAGTQSYTIGINGAWPTTCPSAITDAFIRDGNNLDTPLDVVSMDEWDSYDDKDFSVARPQSLYFDPGPAQAAAGQQGVIWLYPIPDASTPYTLFIGEQKPLTEFSAVTDTVAFLPAYYEALLYNLAVRLYRSFTKRQQPVPADVAQLAKESKAVIERMNAERLHMVSDVPGKKGPYNIYTDSY